MIGISCVPEDIQSIGVYGLPAAEWPVGSQVKQLKALLHWFKHEFFTWCNSPPCPQCGNSQNMQYAGNVPPSAEDREGHATRVENHRCNVHGTEVRFPRYNHPIKLFESRTGRCGEYANCFTALCIALGHDARLILDWTDHVWTEVFIEEFQRWVHLDSCENAFDTPLVYEKGWGKHLTYCIGFSTQEIVDVTPRYVLN